MTDAIRTAFDCACDEAPHVALAVADAALVLLCKPDRWHPENCARRVQVVRAEWERLLAANAGRRGIRQARAVLRAASPWVDSPAESVLRWVVLAIGLPEPVLQFPLQAGGRERFVDLCWPEWGIALEFDGRIKYLVGDAVVYEKLRQDEIAAQGFEFLRVLAEDFHEVRTLVQRILRMFPPEVVVRARANVDIAPHGLWGPAPEDAVVT